MALHVSTKNCSEDAPIRTNSGLQFEVGILLMILGVREITAKNLNEVKLRLALYEACSNRKDLCKFYGEKVEQSVGLVINGENQTWAKFAKRMTDGFRTDYEDRRIRSEELAKSVA